MKVMSLFRECRCESESFLNRCIFLKHVRPFFLNVFRWCATPKIRNYQLTVFCDFMGGAPPEKIWKKHRHVFSENTSIKTNFLETRMSIFCKFFPVERPMPIKHARSDKLSTIASVKLAFRDEKFLVEIMFSLTDKVLTELYKMHPVPIPQEQE